MWTKFWDMHSGGSQKEKWHLIFIEAPTDEAKIIFYNRFGHNPERVTCTCCGEDYSIDQDESLEQITAFHRDCAWGIDSYVEESNEKYGFGNYKTLENFLQSDECFVIYEKNIKPEERVGEVPAQGYVWVD